MLIFFLSTNPEGIFGFLNKETKTKREISNVPHYTQQVGGLLRIRS